MRNCYLNHADNPFGCRGGVGSNRSLGVYASEYEVEIGAQCRCSSEMFSLMVHYDEIIELFELCSPSSSLVEMLLSSIKGIKQSIDVSLAAEEKVKREKKDEAQTSQENSEEL